MALKSARIVDLCRKSSGFADFENTAHRGWAVIFDSDSGLYLSYVPWVLNEIWITNLSSALIGMLMSSSKLFLFSKELHFISGVRLLLELYCAVVIKHVAFFYYFGKMNSGIFTGTSLPLNLYTSVFGCGCGFGFEQKFWRIDGFGEKRHGSADLHTPIHPPLRPRLYGEKLSRLEGSLVLPSQLRTTVYLSKVVPVDRVKVNSNKLFIDPT